MKKMNKFTFKVLHFTRKLPSRQLMIGLSIVVGFVVGMIAVIMKNLVHFIQNLLTGGFEIDYSNYQYVVYPAVGILATLIFIKFILRRPVEDGVPNVLHAISKDQGIIKKHNTFSHTISFFKHVAQCKKNEIYKSISFFIRLRYLASSIDPTCSNRF